MTRLGGIVPPAADLVIVALTLLAAFFGGSTLLGSQTVLLAGAAGLILLRPPQRALSWKLNALFLGFGLLAFASLLPATWFPAVPWRQELTGQFGVALPGTFTPQPWVTLEEALLVVLGLVWGYYLLTREWHYSRRVVLELYAWGVVLITGWSFFEYSATLAVSREPDQVFFGVFPNRNQMGNFMALGAVVMLGLATSDLKRRRRTGWVWIGAWLFVAAGIVVNASRAGLLLLAAGTVVWLVWAVATAPSVRWAAIGAAGVLLSLTLFFLFAGRLIERFERMVGAAEAEQPEFRLLMWKDALRLARVSSWHGVGPGNFARVFARYREASVSDNLAQHPESDWLWLAITMGWPAAVIAAVAVALLLARCRPLANEGEATLRRAALLGVILFLLHSLVDVSAHCLGTLWPAVLLLAMASPLKWSGGPGGARVGGFLRALAAGLTVVGAWWTASHYTFRVPPTSQTVWRLDVRVNEAIARNDYAELIRLSTEGLRMQPLRHRYYFIRAAARARSHPGTEQALRDFQVARYLQPYPSVAFDEGIVWLERGDAEFDEGRPWIGREPELAAAAWDQALRSRPDLAVRMFHRMVFAARPYPEMTEHLRQLAAKEPPLRFVFLSQAAPDDFRSDLDELLESDPELETFTPEQRRQILKLWADRGDPERLEAMLADRPQWLEVVWAWQAERLARRREYRAACELAERFAPGAGIELPPADRSLEELREEFRRRPRDLAAGLALYRALAEAQRTADALALLQQLSLRRDAPKGLHLFEARLLAAKGEWEKAWQAWRRFLSA